MNPDNLWQSLVAQSAPAFNTAETTPPFGLTTRLLAQLRNERQEQELTERIGIRAIMAALAALGVAVLITVSIHSEQTDLDDFDSSVQSVVEMHRVHLN